MSFTEIAIKHYEFETKLRAFESAGRDIDPSTNAVHDPKVCKGLVLTDWINLFRDIGELVSLYKELIEKDAVSVRESQEVLSEADKDRARQIIGAIFKDSVIGRPSATGISMPGGSMAGAGVGATKGVIPGVGMAGAGIGAVKGAIPGSSVVSAGTAGFVNGASGGFRGGGSSRSF